MMSVFGVNVLFVLFSVQGNVLITGLLVYHALLSGRTDPLHGQDRRTVVSFYVRVIIADVNSTESFAIMALFLQVSAEQKMVRVVERVREERRSELPVVSWEG